METQNSKIKILLVDDNPTNLKVLSSNLADQNYKLLVANSGEWALSIAEKAVPDLILLDINLPGMNGFEVCEKLKANPITKEIPVIFLSALDDIESKVQGFHVGGIDYITKPFYKEEVQVRVETQVQLAKLKKKLAAKNKILEDQNSALAEALEAINEKNDALEKAINEITTISTEKEYQHQQITESIRYARRIQEAIIPMQSGLNEMFAESMIFYRPKDIVSGDFYWYITRREKIFIVTADCTGHGVPGAFMSLIGIHSLINLIEDRGVTEPASILEELDYQFHNLAENKATNQIGFNDGMDIAICSIDKRTNILTFAGAYRPLLFVRDGELQEIKGERFPIGGFTGKVKLFNNHKIALQPGDALYMYSDGYPDQFGGPKGKKFMNKRFRSLIKEISALPMEEQKERFANAFNEWKGNYEQTDDVILMGVRI